MNAKITSNRRRGRPAAPLGRIADHVLHLQGAEPTRKLESIIKETCRDLGVERTTVFKALANDQRFKQSSRRKTHLLTWEGRTATLTEWAEAWEIPTSTIISRLRRGWHPDWLDLLPGSFEIVRRDGCRMIRPI
jgi:hypothetical protein